MYTLLKLTMIIIRECVELLYIPLDITVEALHVPMVATLITCIGTSQNVVHTV